MDTLPGTDREYNLICTIKIQKRGFYEIADGKNHEASMALLVPRHETTEASRFLVTYLPDLGTYCLDCKSDGLRADALVCPDCASENINTEHTEVVGWIASPVDGPSRLAVLRKNNYCPQHHLFVMGTGAEDDLQKHDGKEVQVRIFSSLADNEADSAKSVNKEVASKYN